MSWWLPRLAASLFVVAVPVVVVVVLGAMRVVPFGPNRSAPPGLDEVPAELWPPVVLLPVTWVAVGLHRVSRQP